MASSSSYPPPVLSTPPSLSDNFSYMHHQMPLAGIQTGLVSEGAPLCRQQNYRQEPSTSRYFVPGRVGGGVYPYLEPNPRLSPQHDDALLDNHCGRPYVLQNAAESLARPVFLNHPVHQENRNTGFRSSGNYYHSSLQGSSVEIPSVQHGSMRSEAALTRPTNDSVSGRARTGSESATRGERIAVVGGIGPLATTIAPKKRTSLMQRKTINTQQSEIDSLRHEVRELKELLSLHNQRVADLEAEVYALRSHF